MFILLTCVHVQRRAEAAVAVAVRCRDTEVVVLATAQAWDGQGGTRGGVDCASATLFLGKQEVGGTTHRAGVPCE